MTFISKNTGPLQDHADAIIVDLDMHEDEMSPLTQRMKRYWSGCYSSTNKVPTIKDIELMDIYDVASHTVIDDIDIDQKGFRNRFWGGELTWRLSFEGTGKPVTAYQPSHLAEVLMSRYQRIVQSERPIWQKVTNIRDQFNSWMPVEILHLPLRGKENASVQHIISVFDFAENRASR